MAEYKNCIQCGKLTDYLYADSYCSACYGVIWDAGFETTSDWGAKITHNDFMRKIQDSIPDKITTIELIDKIVSLFDPGNWYCEECGFILIKEDEQDEKTNEEIFVVISKKCPKCGKKETVEHIYKGER